jgi:hypothetical protein
MPARKKPINNAREESFLLKNRKKLKQSEEKVLEWDDEEFQKEE